MSRREWDEELHLHGTPDEVDRMDWTFKSRHSKAYRHYNASRHLQATRRRDL